MEQINLKTHISSNNLANIMDITKNSVQNKNNLSFKDYVKSNNTAKSDYNKKEEYKYENKQNDNSKDIQNKSNNIKKDEPLKAPEKKEDLSAKDSNLDENNKKIKQDTKQEIKNTQTINKKETKEKNLIENDEDNLNIENTNDLETIQIIFNNIINFKDNEIKLEENIENLSKLQESNIIDKIEKNSLIPQELKQDIKNLISKINQDNLQKLDKNQVLNTKDFDDIVKLENIISKILKPEKQDDISNFKAELSQEIDILKFQDTQYIKNTDIVKDISINNDKLEYNQEDSIIFTNEISDNNIKLTGFHSKIFTNVKSAMPNATNIQNFSKIVDEMRLAFKDNKTTINIKLEPENLGKLSVKINSENGIFNASFFVESDKTKQIVEQQIQNLRQALSSQGINIQDINVQVGQNNEDLNYHKNLMEAVNFSKRTSIKGIEEDFEEIINPYIKEDMFNDLI